MSERFPLFFRIFLLDPSDSPSKILWHYAFFPPVPVAPLLVPLLRGKRDSTGAREPPVFIFSASRVKITLSKRGHQAERIEGFPGCSPS